MKVLIIVAVLFIFSLLSMMISCVIVASDYDDRQEEYWANHKHEEETDEDRL